MMKMYLYIGCRKINKTMGIVDLNEGGKKAFITNVFSVKFDREGDYEKLANQINKSKDYELLMIEVEDKFCWINKKYSMFSDGNKKILYCDHEIIKQDRC